MLAKWPLTHKHIHLIAGHYGSGKTELAVSLALFAAKLRAYPRIALIDLDIANPYFRSRERRDLLEQAGKEQELSIRIQREDIFDAMHKL